MNLKALKHLILSKSSGRILVERGNEETYYLSDGVAMWCFHSPLATLPDAFTKLNVGIPDLAVGETRRFARTTKTWTPLLVQNELCDQVWRRGDERRTTYLHQTKLAIAFEGRPAIWFGAISNGTDGVFLDDKYLSLMEANPQTVRALTVEADSVRGVNEPVALEFGSFDLTGVALLLCPVVVSANELRVMRKQARIFAGGETDG